MFPKTLRNMWIIVTVFNPLIAFMALATVPLDQVASHKEALLSHMGGVSAGTWLSWRMALHTSSPPRPGNIRSSSTRSGDTSLNTCKASSPRATQRVW